MCWCENAWLCHIYVSKSVKEHSGKKATALTHEVVCTIFAALELSYNERIKIYRKKKPFEI